MPELKELEPKALGPDCDAPNALLCCDSPKGVVDELDDKPPNGDEVVAVCPKAENVEEGLLDADEVRLVEKADVVLED